MYVDNPDPSGKYNRKVINRNSLIKRPATNQNKVRFRSSCIVKQRSPITKVKPIFKIYTYTKSRPKFQL